MLTSRRVVIRMALRKSGQIKEEQVHIELCEDDSSMRKCPRCSKWHTVRENYDDLCDRCVYVILTDHPNHESVINIQQVLEVQRKKYFK